MRHCGSVVRANTLYVINIQEDSCLPLDVFCLKGSTSSRPCLVRSPMLSNAQQAVQDLGNSSILTRVSMYQSCRHRNHWPTQPRLAWGLDLFRIPIPDLPLQSPRVLVAQYSKSYKVAQVPANLTIHEACRGGLQPCERVGEQNEHRGRATAGGWACRLIPKVSGRGDCVDAEGVWECWCRRTGVQFIVFKQHRCGQMMKLIMRSIESC